MQPDLPVRLHFSNQLQTRLVEWYYRNKCLGKPLKSGRLSSIWIHYRYPYLTQLILALTCI